MTLPLSHLRPGVVVPAGAWTDRGMLQERYRSGDLFAWVVVAGEIRRVEASVLSLDLTPPDPPGSRWDGADVVAGMLARKWGLDMSRGCYWDCVPGFCRVGNPWTNITARGPFSPFDNPRAALLAVAVRELCGGDS